MREYISEQFPREYLVSVQISRAPWKDDRECARERLGRKKNRFINSIRFPLHFSSVLRLPPSPLVPRNGPPPLATVREYPRQSSLFARSGAVSLFVIASNFSGRYPVGDKARNLNKTNQYSNPPLSLADSPSVPFSAFFFSSLFFFTSLFIDFYSSLFPAASPTPSATFFSVSLSLVCSDPSFIGTISRCSFIRVSLPEESGDLLSRPFQPLYSLDFNSPNDWFYTWRELPSFYSPGRRKKKYKIKKSFRR